MTRYIRSLIFFSATAALVFGSRVFAQAPLAVQPLAQIPQKPAQPIADLLKAHKVWAGPPSSIQITGTSTRGNVTGPIKITATFKEETLTEYGTDKEILTASRNFRDDGTKITPQSTPSGFMQLDITGVFMLAQLMTRPVTTALLETTTVQGAKALRVRVRGGRSEIHYRQIPVNDEFDLYISESGLLAGISRSFYESMPRFKFTQGATFSDYRDTNGVLLPYRIERYLKGYKFETIIVDSYAVNIPAAPTLFEPRRLP